jgi:hypothetical protein
MRRAAEQKTSGNSRSRYLRHVASPKNYLCHLSGTDHLVHDGGVLRTLVISSDAKLLSSVEPALERLEFQIDRKPTVADGMDKMRYERYNVLVVDCAAGSLQQVDESRSQWLKTDSTVIAVTAGGANSWEGLSGVDRVWAQPLMQWEVYRTLLDLRTQAVGDRRLRKRYALPRAAALRYSVDGERFYEASIVDVTETGLAVEGVETLVTGHPVQIEFKLPALLSPIKTLADVVWHTERRAGLRFLQFPQQQQKQLERWLQRSRLGMSTGYSYAAGF